MGLVMSPALYGVVAAVGWGSSDVIGRVAARELGPVSAMWGLSVTGLVVASLMLFGMPLQLPANAASWEWLLGAAVAAMVGPIVFYRALTFGPMALVAPLSASYPAWVVGIAVLGGFRPSIVAWLAIALVAGGALLVGRSAPADPHDAVADDPANRQKAIVAALLTSLSFAATVILGARSAARAGTITTLWTARAMGTVVIGVTRPWRGKEGFRGPKLWGLLLLQAALDNTAFVALYIGSQHGGAAVTAVASSAFLVVAVLLAALFLKERPNFACLAGAGAVFAGIAVLSAVAP